jgi:hypothetical protein
VAALERASETNEAEEGKFLMELDLAQHIDKNGDAEGGGDFALERMVSMGGRWCQHLMKGPYASSCSIWHSGVAFLASFLASVLTKIPLFNVCSCQEILRCNGRGQIHMIPGLTSHQRYRRLFWGER